MRVGVVFSQADSGTDPDAIRAWARRAEAAGFDHIMVYDHVLGASVERLGAGPFGGPFPAPPYTSEHTFHEILTLISHLAGVTSTIAFVTSVLILPQRQTALAAKQIATVDLLSDGRLRVAVGTGWNRAEYEGLGADFDPDAIVSRNRSTSSAGCGPSRSCRSGAASTSSIASVSTRCRAGRSRSTSAAERPMPSCGASCASLMDGCRC